MSGTSTPRGNRSPPPAPPDGGSGGGQPPPSSGPSPLTIGKKFVKQYYQTLMSNPDQLHRFYQPTSVLSDGDGSSPADPGTFASTYDDGNAEKLKDRFFVKDLQIRFEFEHGAIDAQQSVNGALLLVVTGHVVYYPSASEDEDAAVDDPIRKGFVHTFFLNAIAVGTKKSFYVHNDILRFLKNISEVAPSVDESAPVVTETATPEPSTPAPTAKEPETPAAEPVPPPEPEKPTPVPEPKEEPLASAPLPVEETKTEEKPAPAPAPVPPPVEEMLDEAPGGGVEETKEEPPAPPAPAPAPAPVVTKHVKEEKPSKNKSSPKKEEAPTDGKDGATKATPKGSPRNNKSPQQQQQTPSKESAVEAERKSPVPPPSPAPKPPPGSWASLVAGAGGGSGAATAVKATPPPSVKPPPKPTPVAEKPPVQPTSNDHKKDTGGGPNNSSNNANNNSSNNNRENSHKMGNRDNNMRPKRDPDCTLVIKNLADNTKEADVLGLFEPFAVQTKTRVVGITVAAHRGIAFVDYDSINPVMMAVNQHKDEPMRLFGRVLEVDQKTAEQRARRAAGRGGGGGGGSYRSGSPGHNGGVNRYGSGGRGHRRRDGGGRGDRGMGGRGGRGGR